MTLSNDQTPHVWQKKRDGLPYGSFYGRIGNKPVNLKTDDLETARQRARERIAALASGQAFQPTEPKPRVSAPPAESFARTTPATDEQARSILGNWGTPQTPQTPLNPDIPPLPETPKTPELPKYKDPPKFNKLASAMAGVMTSLNAAAVGLGVRAFGRKPPMPDDADLETLKLGWEMQLEQWFVDAPPKPWMVIAVGSAALGIGLYAEGEPLPKKPEKLGEPTETKEFQPRVV